MICNLSAQVSGAQPPGKIAASICLTMLVASLSATLFAPLLAVISTGREERGIQCCGNVKEKSIIFIWTVFWALAKLSSRSHKTIPVSVISLWRCPAAGGPVQTGRRSSSNHQNAQFSHHLHHLPAPFLLRTPCLWGYNQLSDWGLYWL